MEWMEIIGYLSAVLIGVSLSLIGGGGSILTVPVLVYLFGVSPVLATAYSLFIVGLSALFGAFTCIRKRTIDFRTAIVFAIPSFVAVFATRKFLIPAIPTHLFNVAGLQVTKDMGLLLFFALIMVASAISMIRNGERVTATTEPGEVRYNYPLIVLEGAIVGVLTGLVGAGGGFLIIPALVLLARLPMKMAVGTSLLIIAAKSLSGFMGDIGEQEINWAFLGTISGLAIAGIAIGSVLNKKISGAHLKKGFGWFVLAMAVWILAKELFL